MIRRFLSLLHQTDMTVLSKFTFSCCVIGLGVVAMMGCGSDDSGDNLTFPATYLLDRFELGTSNYYQKTIQGYSPIVASGELANFEQLAAQLANEAIDSNWVAVKEVILLDEVNLRLVVQNGQTIDLEYTKAQNMISIVDPNNAEVVLIYNISTSQDQLEHCALFYIYNRFDPFLGRRINSSGTLEAPCYSINDFVVMDSISSAKNLVAGDTIVVNFSDLVYELQ